MELSEPQNTKQRKINERYYGFFSVHFVVVAAEHDEGRKETKRKDEKKKMKMSTNNVFSKGEIIKP